jgi:hypothetical protein
MPYFQTIGMLELGVQQEEILCTVFCNPTDKVQYQTPHTDYFS